MRTKSLAYLAVLPVLTLSVLALNGCGGPEKGDTGAAMPGTAGNTHKKLTVGFVQIGAESAWRTAETKSVEDEAKARGIDLKTSDAQQKQENEIKSMRALIAQKVDAILLAPVVETGWDQVLKEAKDAKIPVILLDRSVSADPSLYATQIGSDFVEEGKRAGKKLIDAMGGKGNVVVLEGTSGSSAAIDRKKGFEEALKDAPGIKVLLSETGDFKRSKGKEVMEAFMKSQGANINGVFAHNDDMAIGAIQAIAEAGKKPGVDIKIVSVDGIKEALQAVVAGTENGVVECNPLLGKYGFDAIDAALAGKDLPKKTLVKDEEFDKSNAEKALPTRQY
jgi:simple sugar transport system substrate-binding protein